MEQPPYFPSSESTWRGSALPQPHILCRRHDSPHSGLPLDSNMDHVHGVPRATREDFWARKDLERVSEEIDGDKNIKPFVKIDVETIQHFSHEHHLRYHESCNYNYESKHCQACCLQIIVSENFYGSCANLPCKKTHTVHTHPLILHSFPLKPKFEAFVNGMFACNGCDQLNCGFVYKCGEKGCGFQLDVRCASFTTPTIHGNYHQPDHPLFFTKTRDIYLKPHHIININGEEVEIVRNDGSSQAFCYVCGRSCVDMLIFRWLDRYSCTFLCIVTFFLKQISEEIPRITSLSEISSEYTEGELRRDISSEGHLSSEYSEEHVPRYILRNMSLGIFRVKVSLGIPRKMSLDRSMDL
ncbi:BnaCnng72630D, partial [Brassica napus]